MSGGPLLLPARGGGPAGGAVGSDLVTRQMLPHELASGLVVGVERDRAVLGPPPPGTTARSAFEDVVRDGLLHPPCVVSFSGGRDSSAVLAVAADLARREGHVPPVAVSLRFGAVASADEDAWQERVVTALGVSDWERIELTDELDLVGDTAAREMGRHGVLWPPNTHFHSPLAERARGGALLTGFGGDEIMSPGWMWDRVNLVLSRRVRPRPSDVVELLAAHGPLPWRRARLQHRPHVYPEVSWLRPEAQAVVRDRWLARAGAEPVRHDRAVREVWWRSRYLQVALESLHLLGRGNGAHVWHPFADPRFLTAIAAERQRHGPRSRTQAMTRLFSDLLPRETITREGKATFNGAFWGERTRAFARSWEGEGVDPTIVDVDVLREQWSREDPDARSYSLLQALWAQRHLGPS